jgi:hypothetical protein
MVDADAWRRVMRRDMIEIGRPDGRTTIAYKADGSMRAVSGRQRTGTERVHPEQPTTATPDFMGISSG